MHPSVLIADDHQMFSEALNTLLRPDYDIVGLAANGRELTELATKHKPQVIITDLSMPQMNGLDALISLTKTGLKSKFIILTMHAYISCC